MNITELRYLVAIRKWGSVSAAAKQLYAAQPNVSKALKNLEEEYGIRIFERSSTGMIPTEQGRHFIRQAERVLDEVDRLDLDARSRQSSCAELRVVLPHATYASYATVDFLQQMADSQQLRVHIRESGSMEALDHVLRRGYHLALLRYAEEDEDYYRRYCDRHGLHREPVMEFEYRLLTNREGPLAKCEVTDITQLNSYMEVLHGDFQLPGGEGVQPFIAQTAVFTEQFHLKSPPFRRRSAARPASFLPGRPAPPLFSGACRRAGRLRRRCAVPAA